MRSILQALQTPQTWRPRTGTSCTNEGVFYRATVQRLASAASDYVLGRKNATWENWGEFHWTLCLFLFLSWVVLYACLARGVQSSGKAAYFTTIFPVVLLTVLLCRGECIRWMQVPSVKVPRLPNRLRNCPGAG